MKDTSKLILEIKNVVEAYLRDHPNQSIHGLSKRCGIASSTLRRIINLETKKDPKPTTVLGIVSALAHEKNIDSLIKMYDGGEISACLKQCFAPIASKAQYTPELATYLEDREAYIIYKLAANKSGTNRKEIIHLLGKPSEYKIEEMLGNELLREIDGILHAKYKDFSLPLHVAKKHVPELLRFTNGGSRFINRTYIKSFSESINARAYMKIHSIMDEADKKITEVLMNEESSGEVPFFYIGVVDTMEVE